MTVFNNSSTDKDNKIPANAPQGRPSNVLRAIFDILSSVKLAMVLLVAILVSCLAGVTLFSYERALRLIFSTLWFNGLLVLLIVNICFCFFGRIWGRKVTIISFGMILFHLSFVAMLGGIIFNSLLYFRGMIRLTEGETLPSGQRQSYDAAAQGLFFKYSWLKGDITLVKTHMDYTVGGENKRAAYEIEVGDGRSKQRGIIYITKSFTHNDFSYYNDREGYSILTILYDKQGRELYGLHIPLQGLKQKDASYLYTTGTALLPETLPFPYKPEKSLFNLQVIYQPSKPTARTGNVLFKVWPLEGPNTSMKSGHHGESAGGDFSLDSPHAGLDATLEEKPFAEGKAPVGEKIPLTGYYISPGEVRFWVGMTVRFDPGKPIVLASLWAGLSGMIITFIGRMKKRGT